MTNYCAVDRRATTTRRRNSWGVDLNRNFSVGSFFDGYVGARRHCTSGTFAGPSELSEPEARNETYVAEHVPEHQVRDERALLRRLLHVAPGRLQAGPHDAAVPAVRHAELLRPDGVLGAGAHHSYRKTAILPAQTGPVTDVLYSAAGNSADEAYYNHGIIGYDFEIGATKRLADGTTASPGFQPPFGAVPIGGNPSLANEGHDEGMEFSNGNYALLQSALDYSNDTTAPSSAATGATLSNAPVGVKFTTSEAASIYYTTDGSTPTTASTEWKPNRPRELPDPVRSAPTRR